jgi:hypothetical protein
VQLVITNAARWCAPVNVVGFRAMPAAEHVVEPMAPIVIED